MCFPRLLSGTSRRPVQPVCQAAVQSVLKTKEEEGSSDWRWSHIHERIHCWVFPLDISQSRLGDRQTTSNACTLIALMLARYIYHTGHRSTPAAILNQAVCLAVSEHFVQLVANSILEGNEAHQTAVKQRSGRKNDRGLFTVPGGIRAVKGIQEINWKLVYGVRKNLSRFIKKAMDSELTAEFSQVFLVVIIIERAILVLYDRQEHVINVIDGHAHRHGGAIFLSSDAQNLEEFCATLVVKLFPDLDEDTDRFEISCLQILSDLPPGMTKHDSKPRFAPKKAIKGAVFEDNPPSLTDNGTIRVEV